jgi:hypothetical protein
VSDPSSIPSAPAEGRRGRGQIARGRVLAAGLAVATTTFATLVAAPAATPIPRGTAAQFWQAAAHVEIEPPTFDALHAYPARDGFYLFGIWAQHSTPLRCVPEAEVDAALPRVVAALEQLPPDQRTWIPTGFEAWRAEGRGEAGGLVSAITSAFRATLKPNLAEYVAWQESNVDERWGRSRRFGLNVAFESLLFGMLVVVALWPWVRREARPWRWALHLGSVPTLLFAPYLLGYAVWVFTTAGISGGVLYPAIVRLVGTPITWIWTPIDGPILDALPQPFEWLSQTPGPAGSLSGGGVGPTAVVFLSMAVAAASWAQPEPRSVFVEARPRSPGSVRPATHQQPSNRWVGEHGRAGAGSHERDEQLRRLRGAP